MKRSTSESWMEYLLPSIILITGILLRIYPMLTIPFWEDELHTYNFSSNEKTIIQQLIEPQDDRPPLFYLFTKILVRFGSSEIFLRFPGYVAACASLYIVYIFFRKRHVIASNILLFLMTFSLFLIDQGWQFRDYGFLTLITSITLIFVYNLITKITNSEPVRVNELKYLGLISLVGSMTNYIYIPFLFSIVIPVIVTLFITRYAHKKDTLVKLCAVLFPALFFAGIFLIRQTEVIMRTTYFIPEPSITSFVALLSYTYGFISNFSDFPVRELILEQQYFFIACATVGGIFILYKALWLQRKSPLYIFSLCCYGMFICYILSIQGISFLLHRSLFLPKTFTPAIIAAIFSVSTLIGLFIEKSVIRIYRTPVLAALALFYMCLFINMYTSFYKIGTFNGELPNRDTNKFLSYIDKETTQGDQYIFLPTYYRLLYPPYFWRYKNYAKQLIFAQYIANAVDTNNQTSPAPKVTKGARLFFIINPKIFNPEYKMFDPSFVTYTKNIYTRAQQFCVTTPTEVFANELFSIRMCVYKEI